MHFCSARPVYILVSILLLTVSFSDPDDNRHHPHTPETEFPPLSWSTPWVDSVFNSLSLEQRIAQLMMVMVRSDRDEAYMRQMENFLARYNVGGVVLFNGGPYKQVALTNRLQSKAATPLLLAMDAEWGLSMRLDSTIQFPRQITLGAIQDDSLIHAMGLEIGRQLKRLGVHINFAPVVDVNNNPDNPVINFRAFGEDPFNVAAKGAAYMKGMQDAGIFACAKHFPGHGDTGEDSHHTLPVLEHSFKEIDSIHLYPFKHLIRHGLHAVMTAHLHIPVLDDRQNRASSLSPTVVTDLLQDVLGFQGLIITDGLEMRGVTGHNKPGELELQALLAGNDILLLPRDVPTAINTIRNAVLKGELDEEYLNQKCRKVLYYKQLAGLDKKTQLASHRIVEDLNPPSALQLNRRLAQSSITLVKNQHGILPLKTPEAGGIAALAIGAPAGNAMQNMLKRYMDLPVYSIAKNHSSQEAAHLMGQLEEAETVIVSVHNNSFFPSRRYGMNAETVRLITDLAREKSVILCLFANPYSLGYFDEAYADIDVILLAYQDGKDFEEAAAQVIFGGMQARGMLPVSAGKHFAANTGIITGKGYRVGFGAPEDVGIASVYLKKIDSIAVSGIDSGAYPGCQIVLIKDGVVIYDKAFGHHVYNSDRKVKPDDIYDLASLTKIIATTASLMHLSDHGKVNVDRKLQDYLPWLKGTDKGPIVIRELLAHQARLHAWIPFYLQTLENGNRSPMIYSSTQSELYPTEVARNLFIHRNHRDSIFAAIISSRLLDNKNYVYSDLGFILLTELIHIQGGMPLDEYATRHLFGPMTLQTLGFNPLRRFPASRIVPTEYDTLFRKQLLHGHVHDPAAAMFGGLSGHAGLFGNAMDIALMMQLFLQNGSYAGRQLINEETIREFTRVQFHGNNNRRGLGFDKPPFVRTNNGTFAHDASPQSFGHTGFTGTFAWADPTENLVVVFLSNRVHPAATNNKISALRIRANIHQAAYDAIEKSKKVKKQG